MFQYIEFNLDLFKILFQSFFIKDISTEKSIKEKMWQLMKIKVARKVTLHIIFEFNTTEFCIELKAT